MPAAARCTRASARRPSAPRWLCWACPRCRPHPGARPVGWAHALPLQALASCLGTAQAGWGSPGRRAVSGAPHAASDPPTVGGHAHGVPCWARAVRRRPGGTRTLWRRRGARCAATRHLSLGWRQRAGSWAHRHRRGPRPDARAPTLPPGVGGWKPTDGRSRVAGSRAPAAFVLRRLVRWREAAATAATLAWCAAGLAAARRLPPGALAAARAPSAIMWLQRGALVDVLVISAVACQARLTLQR